MQEQQERGLGGRLRAAREAAGLTQVEAAAQIGVGRPRLADWERNEAQPSAANLGRAALVYATTADALLFGEQHSDAARALSVFDAGRWAGRLEEAIELQRTAVERMAVLARDMRDRAAETRQAPTTKPPARAGGGIEADGIAALSSSEAVRRAEDEETSAAETLPAPPPPLPQAGVLPPRRRGPRSPLA